MASDTISSGAADADRVKVDPSLASTPGALVRLGCAMMASGDGAKAVALVKSVLSRNPDDPALKSAARTILSFNIPQWHLPMLHDHVRNDAYRVAIERAVKPGMRVLDIGTGSGLLAMMAARAGADLVVACEMEPAVAATAADIIARNGYSSQVRVVQRKSTELDRDKDLDGGVDVIVSETFSDDLLSESALPSFDHARRELANPDAHYIPRAASMRVALAWFDQAQDRRLDAMSGFDLSLFERHIKINRRPKVGDDRLSLRSDPADLFAFDLTRGDSFRGGGASLSLTAKGGPANGVVQWIRLELDEETVYENQPGPGATSAWNVHFHPLPDGKTVEVGGQHVVNAAHDGERVHFW